MTEPTSHDQPDDSVADEHADSEHADSAHDGRVTDVAPSGTPRPDPQQISQGLSDFGVVSGGGHVGPEDGDQAAGTAAS